MNGLVVFPTFFNLPRGEAGTSGFLSVSDSDRRVPAELGQDIFFAAKDGEALYGQQKEDQELIVAQIMNSLLPNSDLN